ncbi:MAG: hypothetical protein M1819_007246 [Sarea resinae]|nr:MAG: hypothetical protein M1819_007246 [Sarea resinae]
MAPDPEESSTECQLKQPVVVITTEHMENSREKENALNAAITDSDSISAFSDESVQGYMTDEEPKLGGVSEIKEAVDILQAAEIPCCLVAESALIYYGAHRIRHDWHICVPTEHLEKAADLFRSKPQHYEPFRPSKLTSPSSVNHLYPRFKFVGLRLFFVLLPSKVCNLECKASNIEFSKAGLPYPTLPIYAQSLLDGNRAVELDDLIDGMNLTLEWGKEHLDLEGSIDLDWIWWRMKLLRVTDERDLDEGDDCRPPGFSRPYPRLGIWADRVSPEAKKNRHGWKYHPIYETRFRRVGSKDPRLKDRETC